MIKTIIRIGIIKYPGVLPSAYIGILDIIRLANQICIEDNLNKKLEYSLFDLNTDSNTSLHNLNKSPFLHYIILPPSIGCDYFLKPDSFLIHWLQQRHKNGSIISAICQSIFILSETQLLNNRFAAVHWKYADDILEKHQKIKLQTNKTLINDGDIITTSGIVSWVDLALEIIAQSISFQVMRKLGKYLIIDTSAREECCYENFRPNLEHGDEVIIKAQHFVHTNFNNTLSVHHLSELCALTERTFLRRFISATGYKPSEYIQQIRIKKASELIEAGIYNIENIASMTGYEDPAAFRKVFSRITGFSPRQFKKCFFQNKMKKPRVDPVENS
ncbi:GlxA family transcriptional regulator [Aliikangiella sp. IMCC44359]|uniref:GlxA family transcriptional regulator n=1 Tax=Aliikangiella sp. IMCC44359 TaxID=3459125 RepID=UPI00403ADF47